MWGDGKGITKDAAANVKGGTNNGLYFRYSDTGSSSTVPNVGADFRPLEMNYELGEYFDELKYFTNVSRCNITNS